MPSVGYFVKRSEKAGTDSTGKSKKLSDEFVIVPYELPERESDEEKEEVEVLGEPTAELVGSDDPQDEPVTDLVPLSVEKRQKNFPHRRDYYRMMGQELSDAQFLAVFGFVKDIDEKRRPLLKVIEDVIYTFYTNTEIVVGFSGFLPAGYRILCRRADDTFFVVAPHRKHLRALRPNENNASTVSGLVKVPKGSEDHQEICRVNRYLSSKTYLWNVDRSIELLVLPSAN